MNVENEVCDALANLQGASEEIAGRSDSIVDLSREQTEGMGEVRKEITDMSAAVEEVASSAEQVAAESREVSDLASEGRQSARKVVDAMGTVRDS